MTGVILAGIIAAIFSSIFIVSFKKFDVLHQSFENNFREDERGKKIISELAKLQIKIGDEAIKKHQLRNTNEYKQLNKQLKVLDIFKHALDNEENYYQQILSGIWIWFIVGLILTVSIYLDINYLVFVSVIILSICSIILLFKYRNLNILKWCLRTKISVVRGKDVKESLVPLEIDFRATEYYTKTRFPYHYKIYSQLQK